MKTTAPLTLAVLAIAIAGCGDGPEPPRYGAGDVVYLHAGSGTGADRLVALDVGSGRTLRELPAGQPSADWRRVFTATRAAGGNTTIVALATTTGRAVSSARLTGPWTVPAGGALSGDGSTLVLVGPSNGSSSAFALVDASLSGARKLVKLRGSFDFDTLSPDGRLLYLLGYPDPSDRSHYEVRVYDVDRERLQPGAIVDKLELEEKMSGVPTARATTADGANVYTLYRNREEGAFVHHLDVVNGVARCIDLPRAGRSNEAAARHWALALSADQQTLYAANGELGTVVEVNLGEGRVVRSARLSKRTGITTRQAAAYDDQAPGGIALSPSGRTLYVAGPGGIAVVDTARLTVRKRFMAGVAVTSLALAPGGRRLYASGPNGRAIGVLNATTGRVGSRLAWRGGAAALVRVAAGAA